MATNPYKWQAPCRAPDYSLSIDGRDITPLIDARLESLSLHECRGKESDQLDLILDDSDGAMQLPSKGAEIALRIGWAGHQLIDKGLFTVDEVEHSGAPDQVHIKARAANMRASLRTRREHSWHATTVGHIVQTIAARHGLTPRVDRRLADTQVEHLDQTNESDLNFLTRLADQHDALVTVKKDRLLFLPVNDTMTSKGESLEAIIITRMDGDQHRYHTADRGAYSGVRAYWHDAKRAKHRGVLVGKAKNAKRLKDTYGSEDDALAVAKSEANRIVRGKATMELTLAIGRPDIMPQTPVRLQGFKADIDATPWLVVKLSHSIGDGGMVTRVELETRAKDGNAREDDDSDNGTPPGSDEADEE
ncbi:phage late control D family protein [Verminephrobacter aporrectodeae subsp. tuberculatae]|uniref:contractile injection system protein, VgrG/Pvc8 family n=1 Tax=Verminephrobacter aporrectodeae TaxID=1110389 RepID=UPI0022441EFF|nr:contractile injection system protein, VgrG/Pvc8 family [Verminephrobacter aporrectodeae]MCW8199283.1 phage late control D family protein [Verminephrobacter aporrectodeae subsp. tuberculatae]MCW8207646.1 phage late control D family protein [Verminephrobacter aporrectodeae subsp. tuberculatae]